MVADMQADKGQEMARELGDQGAFVQVNVTREAEVKAAIETTVERWGQLDCIYNNAGFGGALGPVESISVEDYDMTFDVLLKGVFLGIKHAVPVMKKQRSGSIISTSSAAGVEAGMATHLYSVAKAGGDSSDQVSRPGTRGVQYSRELHLSGRDCDTPGRWPAVANGQTGGRSAQRRGPPASSRSGRRA